MYAPTLTADMSAVGAVACTADMSAPQQGRRRRRHCERGFGTVTVAEEGRYTASNVLFEINGSMDGSMDRWINGWIDCVSGCVYYNTIYTSTL